MSAVASSPAAGRRRVYRNRLQRMLNSSIGLKITMALTGVILSGFVLVHMLGNLQVYQGAEALDAYGKLLRKEPALLWTFRLVLLSAVGLHIWAFIALTAQEPAGTAAGLSSQEVQGVELRLAVDDHHGALDPRVHHLPHPAPDNRYGSSGFSGRRRLPQPGRPGLRGIVGVIYVVAMIMLAFHLWHGVWSMFQTLGVPEDRYRSLGRRFATIFTILVTLGFARVPLAVLTGFLKLP